MSNSKISALDNAFLFMISSISLVFAIIQVFMSGGEALLLFMPLLFSGLFYLFYVGYLRGAVEGSMVDRTRGWICFVVGTMTYIGFGAVVVFRDFCWPSDFGWIFYFGPLLLGLALCKKLHRWSMSVTGWVPSNADIASISGGAAAAGGLSFASFYLESVLRYWISPPTCVGKLAPPDFSDIWFVLFVLVLFVLIERASRKLPSASNPPEWVEDFRRTPTYGKPFAIVAFCVLPVSLHNRALLTFTVFSVVSRIAYGALGAFWIPQIGAGVLALIFEGLMIVEALTMEIDFSLKFGLWAKSPLALRK